jgi:DNA modification methylase
VTAPVRVSYATTLRYAHLNSEGQKQAVEQVEVLRGQRFLRKGQQNGGFTSGYGIHHKRRKAPETGGREHEAGGERLNEIRIGDCLEIMKLLILGNVKVQTCITSPPYFGLRDYGTAAWEGGDPVCDHMGPAFRTKAKINQNCGTGVDRKNAEDREFFRSECRKCGAVRIDSQLGLEETPAAYVARLVEVFRLVRDLLADDGTLWLNLGDSYAGSWGAQGRQGENGEMAGRSVVSARQIEAHPKRNGHTGTIREEGLKPKDLIGIPWRVALALQADGWYLRSDIIWAKPNPMPESVTDRPTKSHEYLFLLSKSAEYFYDAEAIREPNSNPELSECRIDWRERPNNGEWPAGTGGRMGSVKEGRNKRSVWTVATQPYDGAHFATFPPDLILPCVLAGSRPGDVVFDPFMGSGTTALVAKGNGRRYLGCELNPEYRALWEERLAQEVLFGPEVPA